VLTYKTAFLNLPFALLIGAGALQANAADYIEPPMVTIPAGNFMMGSEGGDPAATPIHAVTLDAFQISKYAVTVAEFKKFAEDTGFKRDFTCNDFIDKDGLRGPTHQGSGRWDKHRYSHSEFQPVVCISWQDAKEYAAWLTKKSGIEYRLPSEVEWEYAAKANTTTRFFWGDDPDLTQACHYGNFADFTGEHSNNQVYGLSNVGWIEHVNCDDGEAYNSIVGLYRPNPFGLYDMLGNVSEFVDACYQSTGYELTPSSEQAAKNCDMVVHRGANWHYPAVPATTRHRFKREGWSVGAGIGFRLVTSLLHTKASAATIAFEVQLQQAQTERLATRASLLAAPSSVQIIAKPSGQYELRWQPVNDKRVTGYEIYRARSPYGHFFAGFYKNHYEKIHTVPAHNSSLSVTPLGDSGSFRVVAISPTQSSLPSPKAVISSAPHTVAIPGKIGMQFANELNNIAMYYYPPTDKLPAAYNLFKTNKNADKSEVSARFLVEVKQSAWYQLNYSGRTFQKGEFFKLWQNNKLLGTIDYDPDIDDKTSSRHKVYLEQGHYQLHLTVMRDRFDRWGLGWLNLSEIE
jgi:formylglycine-generating enzyme required for sulfatase activity